LDYRELKPLLETWGPGLPVERRVVVLQALVGYWFDDAPASRQPISASVPLPAPLEWVYSEVVSRNPRVLGQEHWMTGVPILYNPLRNPGKLQMDAAGILAFQIEQQGVYQCGCRAGDPDGPVYRRDTDTDEWVRCASRLSDFLLWAIVFELIVCRERSLWGLFTPADAAKITGEMTHVYSEKVTTYRVGSEVYHADGIAVLASENSATETCLEAVACTDEAFERLAALEGWMND
jgi:hypothetical protein